MNSLEGIKTHKAETSEKFDQAKAQITELLKNPDLAGELASAGVVDMDTFLAHPIFSKDSEAETYRLESERLHGVKDASQALLTRIRDLGAHPESQSSLTYSDIQASLADHLAALKTEIAKYTSDALEIKLDMPETREETIQYLLDQKNEEKVATLPSAYKKAVSLAAEETVSSIDAISFAYPKPNQKGAVFELDLGGQARISLDAQGKASIEGFPDSLPKTLSELEGRYSVGAARDVYVEACLLQAQEALGEGKLEPALKKALDAVLERAAIIRDMSELLKGENGIDAKALLVESKGLAYVEGSEAKNFKGLLGLIEGFLKKADLSSETKVVLENGEFVVPSITELARQSDEAQGPLDAAEAAVTKHREKIPTGFGSSLRMSGWRTELTRLQTIADSLKSEKKGIDDKLTEQSLANLVSKNRESVFWMKDSRSVDRVPLFLSGRGPDGLVLDAIRGLKIETTAGQMHDALFGTLEGVLDGYIDKFDAAQKLIDRYLATF